MKGTMHQAVQDDYRIVVEGELFAGEIHTTSSMVCCFRLSVSPILKLTECSFNLWAVGLGREENDQQLGRFSSRGDRSSRHHVHTIGISSALFSSSKNQLSIPRAFLGCIFRHVTLQQLVSVDQVLARHEQEVLFRSDDVVGNSVRRPSSISQLQ